MRFLVKSSRKHPLPGNPHMLHLGTLGYGLREFVLFTCIQGPHKGKTFIEEAVLNTVDWTDDVFANLKFIEDDHLVEDLVAFAEEKGLLNIKEVYNELIDRGVYVQ